ncbi:hypothetical protein [Nonomuraea sp. NPDC052265]|uniref:hypothetical protein n=1 Tax=Nonomuraea sp. NPDC052265 TaxID=3364374 RepID=UPI0037C6E7CA
MNHVADVARLLALDVSRLADGTLVRVSGYHRAGDGGGKLVRWDAASTAPANGGTVLGSAPKGRWIQLHDGCLDFRAFGVLDDRTPADAALEAMVNDPAVARIEAHTDLNFVRRHTFRRSDVVLDFGGHTMTTEGIEKNTHDNPFGAVLFFQGERTGTTVTGTLTATIPDLADVFEVDSRSFRVGQWWAVEVDALAGTYERELQRLVQITQIVDGRHVRVNYKNGWELAAGRTLTWTLVNPVERVDVRDLRFEAAPGGDEYTGSHPIAYEYAVHCDVEDVHATGSFWPVIMRRWCTHFRTRRCSLKNPPTVMYGGAGYLTQQIYCLYGHVADCTTSNVRHLNDFTASAYCTVENCHGDGDDEGGNPFTTHGQYEHDLVFTGNSGLMDIANSGALWGTSAKRITVRKHLCSWFVAGTKITDLTLEDVRVIPRSTFDPAGTLQVNADGLHMRGCSARTVAIGQRSNRSGRPNVIEGCSFDLPKDQVLVQTPVSNALHFKECVITGLDGATLRGSGPLRLTGCVLSGKGQVSLGSADVVISGGRLDGVRIELSAVRDQRLRLEGVTLEGASLGRAAGPGVLTWELSACTADATRVELATGDNRFRATGSRFTGGRLDLTAATVLVHTGCAEEGVERAFPPAGPRVLIADTLAL